MMKKKTPDIEAGKLRERAEKTIRRSNTSLPDDLKTLSPEEARVLLHELSVHQIELEMQNEELRRAQAELEASRTRYVDLYDLAPIGYITLSGNGIIQEANLTVSSQLGLTRGALVGRPLTSFIFTADRETYHRHHKQALAAGAPQIIELRLLHKNGTLFWARLEAAPAQDHDGASLQRVVICDINEHKQEVEKQQANSARILRQREVIARLAISRWVSEGHVVKAAEEMTAAVANAFGVERVSVWLFNDDGTELVCIHQYEATPQKHSVGAVLYERQFRKEFEAFKSARYVAIEDLLHDPRTAGYVESCLRPRGITSLLASVILSGDRELGVLCFELVNQPHRWEQDEISFHYQLADLIGMAVLIRERRKAKDALLESEARYRELFEAESDAIVLVDNETGRILEANNAASVLYGYDRNELLTKKSTDLSAEPEQTRSVTQATVASASQVVMIPLRYHCKKDGTLFPVEITGRFFMQQGKSVQIAAIRDITDRMQTEYALRVSEKRFRSLLQHVPSVAVQGYRSDGTTQYWNEASERIYGYTEAEAIGKNLLDLIIPPDMRTEVRQAIRQMAETGRPVPSSELSLMRKDGSRVAVYSSHAIVQSNEDGPELFCLDIDLTELKKAEEQINRSLKEKEVLLKEIHHRVKNNMQVISSLLNLQAKGIADASVRAVFEDARNRVNTMALIHQKLYQSKDLAHINFNDHLKSLVAGIADTFKRNDVVLSISREPVALDVNLGIPCGLIVNELVSNCYKYAFPAGRKGTITVGMDKDSEGNHVLTVADNGIGFPDMMDFRDTSSLGLQLVNVLTGQIHGTIAFSKTAGTSFRITFPGNR